MYHSSSKRFYKDICVASVANLFSISVGETAAAAVDTHGVCWCGWHCCRGLCVHAELTGVGGAIQFGRHIFAVNHGVIARCRALTIRSFVVLHQIYHGVFCRLHNRLRPGGGDSCTSLQPAGGMVGELVRG